MMQSVASRRIALLAWLIAIPAAHGCGDDQPEVKLGKLVVAPPIAGGTADDWQTIFEHEQREIMYFECMRNMPVCGTNGTRYQNPCQAGLAGVEVATELDPDAGGC